MPSIAFVLLELFLFFIFEDLVLENLITIKTVLLFAKDLPKNLLNIVNNIAISMYGVR